MINVLSTIFCIIVGIEFIILLFLFILSSLLSLSYDISAEKRRNEREKREIEYHKLRMKDVF